MVMPEGTSQGDGSVEGAKGEGAAGEDTRPWWKVVWDQIFH